MVFHEEEEEEKGIGHVEGSGYKKDGMVAHDDEDIEADDEDEGMEADYDEVLKTAVRIRI